MKKDKLSDILIKHIVDDLQMKKIHIDEKDARSYTNKITHLTAIGVMLLKEKMYTEAYNSFIKAHVNNIDDFWANYYLGNLNIEANKLEGANYYFRCCIGEAPKDWIMRPVVLTYYSTVQFKLGHFTEAESSLEDAIKINPFLDVPYSIAAVHKIYRKQHDEAYEIIKRGIKKNPDSKLLKHLELDIQEIMENQ